MLVLMNVWEKWSPFKGMDQGRPLGGSRAHYGFSSPPVQFALFYHTMALTVLCCKVAKKFIMNDFSDAPWSMALIATTMLATFSAES